MNKQYITVNIFDEQANIKPITIDIRSIKSVKKNSNNDLCLITTDSCSFMSVSPFEEVRKQIKDLIPSKDI